MRVSEISLFGVCMIITRIRVGGMIIICVVDKGCKVSCPTSSVLAEQHLASFGRGKTKKIQDKLFSHYVEVRT
jgi:hypothetical protein